LICEEAQAKRGVLDIHYPFTHGTVSDWDGFERILHHTFYNQLQMAPEDYPVLYT